MNDASWKPTRWWRSTLADGTLWCESSDEAEVRRSISHIPDATIERLYQRVEEEWRTP